jgi:hypothetical protein
MPDFACISNKEYISYLAISLFIIIFALLLILIKLSLLVSLFFLSISRFIYTSITFSILMCFIYVVL